MVPGDFPGKKESTAMYRLLVRIWRLLGGHLQWYILWLVHPTFMIGVSGVITNEQHEILLLRHRFWRPGSWGLPSGYANRNETLEETLRREVREETHYEIAVTRFLRLVSGYRLRVEVSYAGQITGGVLQLDPKEVLEARFFSLDALPDGLLSTPRALIALAFPEHVASPG